MSYHLSSVSCSHTCNNYCGTLLMSELWHCLILLGVLEVFWFYATLIIFVGNNNNKLTSAPASAAVCVFVSVLLDSTWAVLRAMLPTCVVRLSVFGSAPSLNASYRPPPMTESVCWTSIRLLYTSSFFTRFGSSTVVTFFDWSTVLFVCLSALT